jgi:sugar transferase (PEP-CTERM system associated)
MALDGSPLRSLPPDGSKTGARENFAFEKSGGVTVPETVRDPSKGADGDLIPFLRARGATQPGQATPPQAPAVPRRAASRPPLPRFLPSLGAGLCALDILLLGGAQAIVFGTIHERLALDAVGALLVVALSVLTTLVLFYASGCYLPQALVNRTTSASRLPFALAIGCGLLFLELHYGLADVLTQNQVFLSISRCIAIVLMAAGISLCVAMAGRIAFYVMVHRQWFRRRVLVLGAGDRALRLRQILAVDTHGLVNDLYFVSEAIIGGRKEAPRAEFGDTIDYADRSIDELARELATDEIVIAVDERRGLALDGLLACKRFGIPVTDYNSFVEREIGRVDLGSLEMSWLVYSNGFRMHAFDIVQKRCMDILVSLFLLFLTLPVLLAAMLAIWLEGYPRVFFMQERVTQDGRRFWLYKLRTMRPDAETNGAQWAAENDPRVTRVGAFLRRTRVDEIPQLLNVLRGDMSLVGPRPERPMFVEQLSRELRMYDLRHSVKSGLTGWAQISYKYGASRSDALRKLEYDLYYIKNYSLLRDLTIILQTFRVLIWPPGVR